MKQFILLTLTILSFSKLDAQCDFPRNNGTNQYQNAITYSGEIYRTDLPGGRTVFRVDPSALGFKIHDLTGDTMPVSGEGVWLFRWHYASKPNRWQPLNFDCDQTAVSLQNINGDPIRTGFIECDFFYLDLSAGTSATFMGSVQKNIALGAMAGDRSTNSQIGKRPE